METRSESRVARPLVIVGECSPPSGALAGWSVERRRDLPGADTLGDRGHGVVVDEAVLRGRDDWDQVLAWFTGAARAGAMVVLVHAELPLPRLVALLRRGLLDVVPATASAVEWREALARLDGALRERDEGLALQADAALTQRLLADRRRQVREEAAAEAASLLSTQRELEEANTRLNDHMAQLSLLYRFGRQLSHASNWDDTLRDILEHLARFVGAVGGALVLRTAPGGPYAPRQTYRWDETAWDRVVLRINQQIDTGVASSLLAPGVFQVGRENEGEGGRITALPLEHQGHRLGILLLLFADADARREQTDAYVSFLQMVQVVLSEEVAAAQMLDRLRDVSAFNTRLLETVSSAIWVCDGSGRTIFVNRSARLLLGLDGETGAREAATAIGVGRGRLFERPLTGGAQLDDLPEVFLDGRLNVPGRAEPLFSGLKRRSTPFLGEGLVTDVAGRRVPVRVRTAPMAGRGQDERWLLLVLEDLSEAKRAEAARRRAEQLEALVAMSATLAHEIRNPLMGLSAQAELLADSLPEDDGRRGRIDLITGEVERINRTITDMLQYVRPIQPRREPAELPDVARRCIELARARAESHGVALTVEAPPTLRAVVDPAQIQQVVLNLVLNAVDAAPEGGRVRVRVQTAERLDLTDPVLGTLRQVPGVILSVEDDGPGFGDTPPAKLFQPFYTTKTTGTGLGLAFSRKVVEAHDGEIRAERHDAWTCMRVLLPREAAASRTLAGEAS
jgi:signal transduction histidine kinase